MASVNYTLTINDRATLEHDAKKAVADQIHEISREIMRSAILHCPVDTGRLRASAFLNEDNLGHDEFGFSADYASYVSEGTSRQHANDFFTAAIYKSRAKR